MHRAGSRARRRVERGGVVNIKAFFTEALSSALDLGIGTPDDVLRHVTPEVLSIHLPRPLWARLLAACLGAPRVDARLIVETIGVPNLCEHMPAQLIWAVIENIGARSLGKTPQVTSVPMQMPTHSSSPVVTSTAKPATATPTRPPTGPVSTRAQGTTASQVLAPPPAAVERPTPTPPPAAVGPSIPSPGAGDDEDRPRAYAVEQLAAAPDQWRGRCCAARYEQRAPAASHGDCVCPTPAACDAAPRAARRDQRYGDAGRRAVGSTRDQRR